MTKLQLNKERFIKLCKDYIHRPGRDELLNWLENTDFFKAPCSTKHHLNYAGGLCEHSLNVFDVLTHLNHIYGETYLSTQESIAIVALFHDLCKTNIYKQELKPVKKGTQWVQEMQYVIDDECPLGHGEKSVMLLSKFLSLKLEEMLAIRWHMGAFDTAFKGGDYAFNKASENSLVVLLQSADYIASKIIEKSVSN